MISNQLKAESYYASFILTFFLVTARKEGEMNNIINEETMGQRIKARRKALKMTQEQLAEVMCIPKSTISAYENDKVDIKASVLVELSDHLETTPNFLLGCNQDYDPFVRNAEAMLMLIKDEKMQEMLLAQLKAWTNV